MKLLVPALVLLSFVTCQAEEPILKATKKLQKQIKSSDGEISYNSNTVLTSGSTTNPPTSKCYECYSEDDDWCNNSDDIIDHKANAADCHMGCFYAWARRNGTEFTGRGCAENYGEDFVEEIGPDDCLKLNAEDHDVHYHFCRCSSDYCNDKELGNSAQKLGTTAMTVMIAIIIPMIWH